MSEITTGKKIGDPQVLKTDTFLDELTGIWGLPRERLTEFYGAEKTGKTTAAYHVMAAAQEQGLNCLLVDVENSFTETYAQSLGIDTESLGVLRGEHAEDIMDATVEAIRSKKWDVVVFDSIGSLSSRVEFEKGIGEKTIGVQSSLMSRFVRTITWNVSSNKIVFIGINHTRQDIMTGKNITMGGKLWSEKKKLSIEFREKSGVLLKTGDKVVGKVVTVRVMKNAVGATERKEMDVRLVFGQGFSMSENLLQEAIDKGIITKEGNTHFMNGEKLGMISKVRELMKDESFSDKIKHALS